MGCQGKVKRRIRRDREKKREGGNGKLAYQRGRKTERERESEMEVKTRDTTARLNDVPRPPSCILNSRLDSDFRHIGGRLMKLGKAVFARFPGLVYAAVERASSRLRILG